MDNLVFRLLRLLYAPYGEPLTRKTFLSKGIFSLFARAILTAAILFLLAESPLTELPLPEGVLGDAALLLLITPVAGIFWGPYITLVCRRLQGAGVAIPYLGWVLAAVSLLLELFWDDVAMEGLLAFMLSSFMARETAMEFAGIILACLPLVILCLLPDKPVYGIGVFTGRRKEYPAAPVPGPSYGQPPS